MLVVNLNRPRLMGGIGGEPLHLGEGTPQPLDHSVERLRQRPKLVIGVVHGDPLTEPIRTDLVRRLRHPLDRGQRTPGEEITTAHRNQ